MIVNPYATPDLIPCDIYDADGVNLSKTHKIWQADTDTGVCICYLQTESGELVCQKGDLRNKSGELVHREGEMVMIRSYFKAPLRIVPVTIPG